MAAYEHSILKLVDDWKFIQSNRVEVHLEDCTGFSLLEVLNYLGQDEWQFAGMMGNNTYIMKREL